MSHSRIVWSLPVDRDCWHQLVLSESLTLHPLVIPKAIKPAEFQVLNSSTMLYCSKHCMNKKASPFSEGVSPLSPGPDRREAEPQRTWDILISVDSSRCHSVLENQLHPADSPL